MSFASSEVYEAGRANVIPIGYCVVPCKLSLRLVALPMHFLTVRVIDVCLIFHFLIGFIG